MKIEKLSKEHKRSSFDCGNEYLNSYLKTQASQDARHHVATTFVAAEEEGVVAGFYTICATGLHREVLPADTERRLPKYRIIPAILLGRLAVALGCQGTGLGGRLLINAFERCSNINVAWAFLVTDAKDEPARAFYSHYGFFSLEDDVNHLCLPRKTVNEAVNERSR